MDSLRKIPTPCHIINIDTLSENLHRINEFKKLSGCTMSFTLKGFSEPYFFKYLDKTFDSMSASSLYEAKLASEIFKKRVQIFSPAYLPHQINDILQYSDTIIFNTIQQLKQYYDLVKQYGCSIGIRINPHFNVKHKDDTNYCMENSHLGIPIEYLTPDILQLVDGVHVHCMCEQYDNTLEQFVDYIIVNYKDKFKGIKWFNIGGGQMIGSPNYNIQKASNYIKILRDTLNTEIIMEPSEGVFVNCGYFATQVLDIVDYGDVPIAILDSSGICHMQDAVFRGWQRDIVGESINGNYKYKLVGTSCFAGDTYGIYAFNQPLNVNEIIYFEDTATYTIVKNTTFNGIVPPSICEYSKEYGLVVVKEGKI